MSARILVVEDNPDLAFGLAFNLEVEGYLSRCEKVVDLVTYCCPKSLA